MNKSKNVIVFFCVIFAAAVSAYSQTAQRPEPPEWYSELPAVVSGKNYIYTTGRAFHANKSEAERIADSLAIVEAIAKVGGMSVSDVGRMMRGSGIANPVSRVTRVEIMGEIDGAAGYEVYSLFTAKANFHGADDHFGVGVVYSDREYLNRVARWNNDFERRQQELARLLQDRGVFYLDAPPSRNPIAAELARILRSKITIGEGTCQSGMRLQIESPREPTCVRGARIRGYSCRAEVSLVVTQCNGGTQNTLRGTLSGIDTDSENNAGRKLMQNIADARFWDEWVRELEQWSNR